jgi:ketosteroid isomerase-like protein
VTDHLEGLAETIAEARETRCQRLLDGEIDAMVDGFYAEDARLLPPDQPTLEGREALREFWKEAPRQGLMHLELKPREVAGSGDLAYERGEFARRLRPRHGHPFKDVGKYLVVYRRQPDGRYRAIVEIFNSPRGR